MGDLNPFLTDKTVITQHDGLTLIEFCDKTETSARGVLKICRGLGYTDLQESSTLYIEILSELRDTIIYQKSQRSFLIKLFYGGKPPKKDLIKRKKRGKLKSSKKYKKIKGTYSTSGAFGSNTKVGRISIVNTRM
jgi:hypothetical protein